MPEKLTYHLTTLAWNHSISRIMSGNSPEHKISTTCVCLNLLTISNDSLHWFGECNCRKLLSIQYSVLIPLWHAVRDTEIGCHIPNREGRLFELEVKTNKEIDPWITNNTSSVQFVFYILYRFRLRIRETDIKHNTSTEILVKRIFLLNWKLCNKSYTH